MLIVTDEIGAPPEDFFEFFDPSPLAAAWLGQAQGAVRTVSESS